MNPIVQLLLNNLLSIVVAVATPVLLGLINKWLSDHHLQINQAALNKIITDAIAYAEEQGHKAIQTGAETPNSKLDMAIKYAMDEMVRLGLKDIASEQLAKLVEASLNKTRSNTDTKTTISEV